MERFKIREARKKAKMTQDELAQILGINRATLSRYESGGIDPPVSQFQAIAAALGVDVNWLMNGQTLEQRDQAMKDYVERRFTEAELDKRLKESYSALTLEGKGKAVDSVEIIAGNPRYMAPQSPPVPPEGQSTTPPPDAPKRPSEGK